ncbi:MAG: GNAT family N-acetyltransferase [Methylophilaceae bacterium]|nr:GNAT family N-acetyltransferase [Methylophilaceae bacterium]
MTTTQITNVEINSATYQDIPALADLLTELFSIEKDFKPDTAKQVTGLGLMLNKPEQAVIKVARNGDGTVIGMVSAQLVISPAEGPTSAWVEDMIISKNYRAAGLGRMLLVDVLRWAQDNGATRAQLLVDTENEPAVGYYKHLGWETTQLQARRVFI